MSFQTEVQSIGQWYLITRLLLFGRARPIVRDAESVKRSPCMVYQVITINLTLRGQNLQQRG